MSDVSLRYLLFGEDRSASSTLQKVGSTGQRAAGMLSSAFSRVGSQIGGEVGELMHRFSESIEAASNSSSKLGARLTKTGGIATATGIAMMAMGAGEQQAEDQLRVSVQNTGNSYEEYEGKVKGAIDKQVGFGNSAHETMDSLRILTDAYGDPDKALERLSVTTDLAASKHISLSSAAQLVARAHGGAAKVFKQYGIVVGTTKNGTKDYEGAIDQLAGKLKGQGAAAVDNFSGHLRVGKTWIENGAASLSKTFGPAVLGAGQVLLGLGFIMETTRGKAVALKVAELAGAAASKLMAGAQLVLNAVMRANPIGLVITALALLAVGLKYAWDHSETFRRVVRAALDGVAAAWRWLWNNVVAPIIRFMINGFANLVDWVGNFLDAISHVPGFGWAADAAAKMHGAAGAARNLASSIRDIPDNTQANVSVNIYGGAALLATMRNLAAVRGAAKRAALGFATGGSHLAGGLALVGENGPELMRIPHGATIYNADRTAAMLRGAGGGGGHQQPTVVQFWLDGRMIQQSLLRLRRGNGGAALGLG